MREVDLEARLRGDARARDAADEFAGLAAPPLDEAVATATGRRLRYGGWLAIAASVLVVAAIALALTVHGRGSGGQPADGGLGTGAPRPLPGGVPAERGNERLFYFPDLGFDAVFRVPGDPNALAVLEPAGGDPGSCGIYGPEATVAAETSRQIQVRVSGFQYLPKSDLGKRYFGFSCFGTNSRVVVHLRLTAPVGNRMVIDSERGSRAVVPADPADLPTAAVLPRGYRQTTVLRASASADRAVGERIYTDGSNRLILQVGPPDQLKAPKPKSTDQLTVDGKPAVLSNATHKRCLTWTPSSGRPRRLCSEIAPGGVLLTAAELLRVASKLSA